jgi:hypothetical protein
MDTVFFLLLLLNFGFGVLAVVFLSTVRTEPDDPGVRSLAFPFIPLTIISGLQVAQYYLWNRYDGPGIFVFSLLSDLAIVGIAFSWNYVAVRHYLLNGITTRPELPVWLDSGRGIVAVLGNNVLARNAKTFPQASGGDFC